MPWELTGNAKTNPTVDFLGTTDSEPLIITTNKLERVRIDPSGNVGIGTKSPQSALQIKALTAVSEGASAAGAWANIGSNSYYDGAWKRIDATKAGVNFHMNADDGAGQEFRFQRIEADGSGGNLAVLGSTTSFILKSNLGLGTSGPLAKLDVRGQASFQGVLSINHAGMTGIGSPNDTRAAITFGATDTPAAYFFGVYDANSPKASATLGLYSYQFANWLQVWTPNGNIGIGTTTPRGLLSLGGAAGIKQLVYDGNANYNAGFGVDLIAGMNSLDMFMGYGTGSDTALNIVAPTGPWPYSAYTAILTATSNGVSVSTLSVAQGASIGGYLGINLDEFDVRRDGEPSSPLVVHGDIKVIGNGNVKVSGDVLLTGADCAEEFDVADNQPLEPGTVVVIHEDESLRESREAYDHKVAGVVSGAGEYRHGLVLDKRFSKGRRIPVALVGKVYCKVDAQYSPIHTGDLLTTSPTPGHAMKAVEPLRAYGSVIGKALKPLQAGQGLIPILIGVK